MSKRYSVAVIGCGSISRRLPPKDFGGSNIEFVAATDINQNVLKEYGKMQNVKNLYTDYKEMIKVERPDVVLVNTHPYLHYEMTIHAAKSGVKGIICQKPLASTLEEVDKMIEACDKLGTKLATGYQRRFFAGFKLGFDMFKKGELGTPTVLIANTSNLMNHGPHLIDYLHLFGGKIKSILGQVHWAPEMQLNAPPYIRESASIGYLEFENGNYGIINDRQSASCDIRIIGTDGRMSLDLSGNLKVWLRGNSDWIKPEYKQEYNIHRLEIEDIISAIEENRDPLASGREGRITLEIIMGIFESSRIRGPVTIPLKNRVFTVPDQFGE